MIRLTLDDVRSGASFLRKLRPLLRRPLDTEQAKAALGRLLRDGVYLTVDEFKGRRPARRGSAEVVVTQPGLRNPGSIAQIEGTTSGSRGTPTPVPIDVGYLRTWAENLRLQLEHVAQRGRSRHLED